MSASSPSSATVQALLAQAQRHEQQHELQQALLQYVQVLAQEPAHVAAWLRIGRILLISSNWTQAINALQTALALTPDSPDALRMLAYAQFNMGCCEEARATIEKAAACGNADSAVWVLRAWIHSSMDRDPQKTLAVHRDWGRRMADPLTRAAKPLRVTDRDPRKRLKVGYVTADFRRHSIAFFMLPVLQHHDPAQVEVHVFSSGKEDEVTATMRPLVPHWHDVVAMTDDELCRYVRSLGIDVLVDLSGHTMGQRLLAFARRAAPVQVTWLGYMNTLGMEAMDYRLTDYGIDPVGVEAHYSETLFRLACMASYSPPVHAPLREEPPMLHNGYPTLISLNSSTKLTDEMLAVWCRILQARADARLIIMVKENTAEAAQAAMQSRVEAAGMPLDRVFVMHQQPLEHFMELGHVADVALDTSPISGGTTTMHALWMGLPIVCMDAQRAIDASTARTLQGLGFGGEVARDADDYVDRALVLLNDPPRLCRLRANVRDWLSRSVLMNYAGRTAELEKAFRLMWLNYLSGQVRSTDVKSDLEAALHEFSHAGPPAGVAAVVH